MLRVICSGHMLSGCRRIPLSLLPQWGAPLAGEQQRVGREDPRRTYGRTRPFEFSHTPETYSLDVKASTEFSRDVDVKLKACP